MVVCGRMFGVFLLFMLLWSATPSRGQLNDLEHVENATVDVLSGTQIATKSSDGCPRPDVLKLSTKFNIRSISPWKYVTNWDPLR